MKWSGKNQNYIVFAINRLACEVFEHFSRAIQRAM